ncbi:heme ABC transporter ATP-binding protein [Microbacterium album]|uniref:Hemin import ATP-binding protein HmuV n=1 Tax=Microbacterium album TaxID=2053191 RepID=A0A917IKH8_9MICO|nr:heme ABC transporter ATP-binding protein [Microbacterium album]GGH51338.1 hemin import ATP-binding protein HmuV [Microbacterium album]
MTVRIAAHGVTVVPDGARRAILEDAAVEIHAGEVHALVGPNGAGKSTLFGVLAGDTVPTSGTVRLDGRPLGDHSPKELARLRAVLLQHNAVSFPFTVRQVVEMGRTPWARTPREAEDDDAIARALADTDIVAHADRTMPSLSGGERSRAALARVLAQGTDILFLDEPTAALDLKHQEDVLALAREHAARGAAVAIVLHDLNAALSSADRVTLLSAGRIVATGTPDEVLTAARIEDVYDQPVDVFPHPLTGVPLIVPRKR